MCGQRQLTERQKEKYMKIRDNARRDLLEHYFAVSKDPAAADELAEIYLSGCCNEAVPELNKALRCAGYVYDAEAVRLCEGEMDGKFIFAALRMGRICEGGLGIKADVKQARRCYLQAGCAIRLREKIAKSDGMEELWMAVRKGLGRTGLPVEDDIDTDEVMLHVVDEMLHFEIPAEMSFERLEKGERSGRSEYDESELQELEVVRIRCRFDLFTKTGIRRRVLITIPEIDFCELKDCVDFSLLCRISGNNIPKNENFIHVTEMCQEDGGIFRFMNDDNTVAVLTVLRREAVL